MVRPELVGREVRETGKGRSTSYSIAPARLTLTSRPSPDPPLPDLDLILHVHGPDNADPVPRQRALVDPFESMALCVVAVQRHLKRRCELRRELAYAVEAVFTERGALLVRGALEEGVFG